jgi:hypothetical protein
MAGINKYVVDGVEYDSLSAMPADVRARCERAISGLEDRDGDGVPDILQDVPQQKVEVQQSFVVNGKRYDRAEDVPEEIRALLGRVAGIPGQPSEPKRARPVPVNAPVILDPQAEPRRYPWSLILALLAILAAVVGFWASGISPGDLLRRFR